jgi:hypothetical protein
MRLTLPLLLLATACDRDAQYEIKSFASSVATTWAECDPGLVPRLAKELQVKFIEGFEPCHSNNFTLATWAPDGVHLYFQLAFTGHVLNGETRALWAVSDADGLPVGNAAWLSNSSFAVPIDHGDDGGVILTVLSLPGEGQTELQQLKAIPLNFADARWAQASQDGKSIFISGVTDDTRSLYKVDLETGKSTQAFAWLDKSFDSFSYHAGEDLVFLGRDQTVTAYKGATGTAVQIFENASRATMHPLGTLIALEATGNPISTYTPKHTGELTETMKRREAARKAKWDDEKPDWIPESIEPPAIDFWDVENKRRIRFFQIHGDNLQWYPGNPYYLSFRLWGLRDQQLNPNILLSDIPARLKTLEPEEPLDPGMLLVKTKNNRP